jgi:hypothetical protein
MAYHLLSRWDILQLLGTFRNISHLMKLAKYFLTLINQLKEGRSKMRVLIMSDMEGVSGIVVWDQVNGGAPMYEEGRQLYTEEINAAVRGAKAAGATEIVVVDCHGAGKGWSFNSLIPERLDPDCQWVAHHGWGRYTEMWENGCDACLTRFHRSNTRIFGLTMIWLEKRASMPRSMGTMACQSLWLRATRRCAGRRRN